MELLKLRRFFSGSVYLLQCFQTSLCAKSTFDSIIGKNELKIMHTLTQ